MTLAWRMTHPIIRSSTDGGEGLILRPWSSDDAEAVYQACQDSEIIRWTTVPYPYTQDHAASFTDSSASTWQKQTGASFAVVDETTNAVLASCGLVDVDQSDSTVEVGYWVAPWARGRGVATAATRAVTRWAIEELGAKRVTLEAASTNYASQQVALNAGFTAKAFKDPKPHDSENAMTWCCSLCCPAKDNTDTAASPCIVNEQAPLRRKPFPGRDVLRFNGRFSAAVLTSCRADHAAASVPSRSAVLRCRSASARSRSACASASLTALSSAPGLSTSTP